MSEDAPSDHSGRGTDGDRHETDGYAGEQPDTERSGADTETDDPFADSIDWTDYWRDWTRESAETYPATVAVDHADRVERFWETCEWPDSTNGPVNAAFVGCGPGELPATMARRFPTTAVVGYDAAPSAVTLARERASELSNCTARRATLPAFEVDRRFDFVWCYATLHYVRETERAVEALFDRVGPGGRLVCTYPNEAFRAAHADASGRLRDRFRLAIRGENLLSADRIESLLDREVRDFWTLVGADGPFVRESNPCIVAQK